MRELIHDPDPVTRMLARQLIVGVTGDDGADSLRFRVDDLTGTDWLDPARGAEGERLGVSALGALLHDEHPVMRPGAARSESKEIEGRRAAVRAFGQLRSPDTIPLLIEALALPDLIANQTAAEALGRRGAAANTAAVELERVALTHWSPDVSSAAARALEAVSGKRIEVPSAPQPVPFSEADHLWRVGLGARRVYVPRLEDPGTPDAASPDRPERPCEHWGPRPCNGPMWKWLRVDREWLALVDHGEWGASIITLDTRGSENEIWRDSLLRPSAILHVGGKYLVVGAPDHWDTGDGWVLGVRQDDAGQWSAKAIVALSGKPIGAVVSDGVGVLIVGERRDRGGEPQQVAAYSVDESGNLLRLALVAAPETPRNKAAREARERARRDKEVEGLRALIGSKYTTP